ncbi:MAG TPA: MetQ/NlpA family ABC transporter substrate-binding protein [Microbacteriaceae bacterium]|nr:MetQ/NlpA family ABC transporter substrate-binding protein [Microbacteriaceae bacterium]
MSDSQNGQNPPRQAPKLPEKATKKRGRKTLGWVIVAVVVAAAITVTGIVVGNRTTGETAKASAKTVSIGVTDAAQPYWKTFSRLAAKELDVKVKIVNFTDYSQPNPALSQGQLDLNEFQHIEFLADYNVSAHDDLQPIGATAVYPLPLYSTKYTSVSALPKGGTVALPNDAINEARGLLVLQSAKLLTLKDGGTPFSTASDIVSSKVKVLPVDAAQTAVALKNGSAVAAIVNNNFAVSAGLPHKDAIFTDDPASPSAKPYVNVFVARAADKNNALYKKLAALYQNPAVKAGVQKSNGGTAVFRTTSAKELQAELAKVEAQERATKK